MSYLANVQLASIVAGTPVVVGILRDYPPCRRSGIAKTFVIARLRSSRGDLYRLLRYARNDISLSNPE